MPNVVQRDEHRDKHTARLRRGQRAWDLGARRYTWVERKEGALVAPLAIDNLKLRLGERVLDIGCGTGPAFPGIRAAVGPTGRVVGVDYSPKMVRHAAARIREEGWDNVEVHRTDFTRPGIPLEGFDAALALATLSAMPDVPAAVTNAYDALRPGGRLFIFDFQLEPRGRGWLVLWGLGLIYRALAGWTGVDVLATTRSTFDHVELVAPEGQQPNPDGWVLLLVATKAGDGS